jgi:hypothetical protein
MALCFVSVLFFRHEPYFSFSWYYVSLMALFYTRTLGCVLSPEAGTLFHYLKLQIGLVIWGLRKYKRKESSCVLLLGEKYVALNRPNLHLNIIFLAGLLFRTESRPPIDWMPGGGQTKGPAHSIGYMQSQGRTFFRDCRFTKRL